LVSTFHEIQAWPNSGRQSDALLKHGVSEEHLQKCSTQLYNFQTALKIFNKYDFLWSKLDIKNFSIAKDVVNNYKKLGWMLYIYSKNIIFEGKDLFSAHSLPECVLLIVSILHLMVTNCTY
jgi:hypothetical protein